jgi:hypothetical protein
MYYKLTDEEIQNVILNSCRLSISPTNDTYYHSAEKEWFYIGNQIYAQFVGLA